MKCLFLLFTTFVALVNAKPTFLVARQLDKGSCADQGYKDCGVGCIPTSWSCCPDKKGGCPSRDYCSLGSNDEYGCCLKGEICSGPAPSGTISPMPEDTDSPDASGEQEPTTTVEEGFGYTATVEEPLPTTHHQSTSAGSAASNAGTSNQLDNTIRYLLAGIVPLLV
ncbi:hypothetical protein DER46DRAFT_499800 [Fusarium sp. MPI-SDFR-AT-0072]|nr:hypothetical protein DER46DRAFT_499800 [Fusarium sp. MPI-SDFR-AT-0072]